MANRVVLGSFADTYVLRVSKPGFNVLDDTLSTDKVVFDSRWAETGNVMQSGTVVPDNLGVARIDIPNLTGDPVLLIVLYRAPDKFVPTNFYVQASWVAAARVQSNSLVIDTASYGSGVIYVFYAVFRNVNG